jgi:hypothetical protein
MKKLWDKVINSEALPSLLGLLAIAAIILFGLGCCTWSIKWLLTMWGVIV